MGYEHVILLVYIHGLVFAHWCEMMPMSGLGNTTEPVQGQPGPLRQSINTFQSKDAKVEPDGGFIRVKRQGVNNQRAKLLHFGIQDDEVLFPPFPDKRPGDTEKKTLVDVCEEDCKCVVKSTTLQCSTPNTISRIPKLKNSKLASNITFM